MYDAANRISEFDEQVRALLGRDENELPTNIILLDVYAGKAARDAERASGIDGATLETEDPKRLPFENLVTYKTALALIPHCMSNEATLQQTANAKIEFTETDWDALRDSLLDGVRAALDEIEELDEDDAQKTDTYFRLAGPRRWRR